LCRPNLPAELPRLKLADPDDLRFSIAHGLRFSIAHGLRFSGRKRVHYADNQMADIAAEHLLKHLEARGVCYSAEAAGTAAQGAELRAWT
jgi:hypothetical protein